MEGVITGIAETIDFELGLAKTRIRRGREDMQTALRGLPKDLRSIGREAAAEFDDQFDDLTHSVDDKATELVDTLATRYSQSLKEVDEEIAEEKEKNKGLVAKAIDAVKDVIQTIKDLKDLLLAVLRKARQAILDILKDPIGFLGNLVSAVGGGIRLFITNIGKHLPEGSYPVYRDGVRGGWNSVMPWVRDYDFELGRWLRSGSLLWIAPGDESARLREGPDGCPFVNLPGTRELVVAFDGKVSHMQAFAGPAGGSGG